MSCAKSTLNLKNYWDRVVEVIRSSEWYNIDKPKTRVDSFGSDGRQCTKSVITPGVS